MRYQGNLAEATGRTSPASVRSGPGRRLTQTRTCGVPAGSCFTNRTTRFSMMRCAQLFATALAHSLYGQGILQGDDLVNTIYQTLFCSLFPPPDGKTFADSARGAARLALTIMRENGLQPPRYGGSPPSSSSPRWRTASYSCRRRSPPLISRCTAILQDSSRCHRPQPLACFPIRRGRGLSKRPTACTKRSRNRRRATPPVPCSRKFGLALALQGDREGALAKQSEAARLGSVQAMAEAAQLARDLGRAEESRFWEQSACRELTTRSACTTSWRRPLSPLATRGRQPGGTFSARQRPDTSTASPL